MSAPVTYLFVPGDRRDRAVPGRMIDKPVEDAARRILPRARTS